MQGTITQDAGIFPAAPRRALARGYIVTCPDGEAELGFATMSSLASARGVDVVGLFPLEFQDYVVYAAGVNAAATDKQAAKALIDFLRKESTVSVMKAKGLESVAH